MYRTDQPAEWHLHHNTFDTFMCKFGSRLIIKKEHDAGHNLNRKEHQRKPAEIIPDRGSVMRDNLFLNCFSRMAQMKRIDQICFPTHAFYDFAFGVSWISSSVPLSTIVSSVKGDFGRVPGIFTPLSSYFL